MLIPRIKKTDTNILMEDKPTMNVVRVVQRFGTTPDDSKGGIGGRSSCGVSKLHAVAVYSVTQ